MTGAQVQVLALAPVLAAETARESGPALVQEVAQCQAHAWEQDWARVWE